MKRFLIGLVCYVAMAIPAYDYIKHQYKADVRPSTWKKSDRNVCLLLASMWPVGVPVVFVMSIDMSGEASW